MKSRRVLSVFLALCLLLSAMPLTAFAGVHTHRWDMDHVRWSKTYWAKSTGANTRIGNTPDSCASYLKEFIRTHMNAMDKAYPEKVR